MKNSPSAGREKLHPKRPGPRNPRGSPQAYGTLANIPPKANRKWKNCFSPFLCQWRAIPKDLPARSTLYDYFDLWSYDGTLDRPHDALYVKCREQACREASPTAAILDSQSIKSAEKGGVASTRMAMMRARATTKALR